VNSATVPQHTRKGHCSADQKDKKPRYAWLSLVSHTQIIWTMHLVCLLVVAVGHTLCQQHHNSVKTTSKRQPQAKYLVLNVHLQLLAMLRQPNSRHKNMSLDTTANMNSGGFDHALYIHLCSPIYSNSSSGEVIVSAKFKSYQRYYFEDEVWCPTSFSSLSMDKNNLHTVVVP
jgi:hypothetical protein